MGLAVADVMARAGIAPGDLAYTVLKGGLSHRVIRVDAAGRRYILRVLDPAVTRAGLGIPLRQEIENTVRAAGIGPRVIHVVDEPPSLILEYIDGRTLCQDDVRDREMIPRLARACRRLHAVPGGFSNEFDIFAKQRDLLDICRRHELRIPEGYADYLPVAAAIERAMRAAPLPRVPCHNDLLPENFMEDPSGVRIVDYQLSGMNDPAFELGDVAAEGDFGPDRVEALAAAYFGASMSPALFARVRLYLAVSNFTWTLWFSVHHGLLAGPAAAGFDYWAEAADKWAQAVRDLSDPGLGQLINLVHRSREI